MGMPIANPPPLARPPGVLSGLLPPLRPAIGKSARPARLEFPYPLVSFTFDGFPADAARSGATLLEKLGARGTFYASASQSGYYAAVGPMFSQDDLLRVAAHGHEIGCATHSWLDCSHVDADVFLEDIVENGHALGAMGLTTRLQSFAYPFGRAGRKARMALPARYLSARGIASGLASGHADLACLRSNAMYGVGALRRCLILLEKARRATGWVIFHAHDVAARPSPWGVPTGLLERLCGAALTSGMRIVTVTDALTLAASQSGAPAATGR